MSSIDEPGPAQHPLSQTPANVRRRELRQERASSQRQQDRAAAKRKQDKTSPAKTLRRPMTGSPTSGKAAGPGQPSSTTCGQLSTTSGGRKRRLLPFSYGSSETSGGQRWFTTS
ncbi:hypothetical protein CF326_g8751 [Tilletia indica]|nr:hypothetical protein CF326_g8751 [Tilletia indica]